MEKHLTQFNMGSFTHYFITEGGSGEGGLLMLDYGGGREVIWWHKQIKTFLRKNIIVFSISLIVLYNNKVNHTLCNALGYKLFTFLCKYVPN